MHFKKEDVVFIKKMNEKKGKVMESMFELFFHVSYGHVGEKKKKRRRGKK